MFMDELPVQFLRDELGDSNSINGGIFLPLIAHFSS